MGYTPFPGAERYSLFLAATPKKPLPGAVWLASESHGSASYDSAPYDKDRHIIGGGLLSQESPGESVIPLMVTKYLNAWKRNSVGTDNAPND